MVAAEEQSTGARLYNEALAGGAQALGRAIGAIEAGKRADFVVLDAAHPDLGGGTATALDAYIFVTGAGLIKTVIVGGETVVVDGQHKHRDRITARYRKALRQLNVFA